jgi:outer membrane lipoprotein-sorting protein
MRFIPVRSNLWPLMIIVLASAVSGLAEVPPAAPLATAPALDPAVDKILTRLENRTVHDLRAQVTWRLQYVMDDEEDAISKQGQIWYQQQEPVSKFLVHFERSISAGRAHRLDERHLFDGQWYVSLDSQTRTVVRRQVRRPDDRHNPYRLGEGPFPVPFGQKKSDILAEFEVTLVAPEAGDPPDTDHLRLEPRPDSQTGRTYKTVDVWIAREGPHHGLPFKVHTSKKDGTGQINSFISITFSEARLNEGFSGGVFEIKTPRGYQEEVEELRPAQPPAAADTP